MTRARPETTKRNETTSRNESLAGPHPQAARQLRTVYDTLVTAYGPQRWWPAQTRLEVIVGAYLTQNTSWRAVERSIANLNAHGLLTIEGLRAISPADLRQHIRPSGYMIRKAAAIQAFVAFLDRDHRGSLEHLAGQPTPTIRAQLLALPGVGPETADAILLYALGHPVIVVDEYLRRITTRHNLAAPSERYPALQQLGAAAFAADDPASLAQHFNEFHALIVEVGKTHCGPRPRCAGCPLAPLLPPADLPARAGASVNAVRST